MWLIENHTDFKADRGFLSDRDGKIIWVVIVKGTYLIDNKGELKLSQNQEDIYRAPVYTNSPDSSSMLYDTDFVPAKPATDIILNGYAHSPGRKMVNETDVTLKIGQIEKTLHIIGDCYWEWDTENPVITEPEPFERIQLSYERAFGGENEPRNPVGCGYIKGNKMGKKGKMPNIFSANATFSELMENQVPVGFGAIAPSWSPRRELAGTLDENWKRERYPLMPYDFNDAFYLCAPEDQVFKGYLKGGEKVELYNLTPEGLLAFTLPEVSIRMVTHFYGFESIEHKPVINTVILEPEVSRLMIVWHSGITCNDRFTYIRSTEIHAS